jgi:putative PIG3 family NAD(P)H quinone oxidoreductase
VNRADLLQRQGTYGDRPNFGDSPLLGLELAGEVIEIGSAVEGFVRGDLVMGIVGGGAYAELARVHYRLAMPIPKPLTALEGAAIPEVFVTAHEALVHLGGVRGGDWVLIHAASGGVGTAAVQLAAASGAKSIYTAAHRDSLAKIKALGGTIGVNYKEQDFEEEVSRATDGRGVDIVVDFIGAPYLERNIRCLTFGGRLVQVGLMGGGEGKLQLDRVLHRHLRIFGTVMKSRAVEEKSAMVDRFRDSWLEHFARGSLRSVIDSTFPLERAAEAHRRMESNLNFGKILLIL